jgi:hypothetical protein
LEAIFAATGLDEQARIINLIWLVSSSNPVAAKIASNLCFLLHLPLQMYGLV